MLKVGNPPPRLQDAPDYQGGSTSGFLVRAGGVFSTRIITPTDLPDVTTALKGAMSPVDKAKLDARAERYMNDVAYATGLGTSASPWVGFSSGFASGTAMRMAPGVYGTNGGLDVRDLENFDLQGVGGRIILKNTSSGATDNVVNLQNAHHRIWSKFGRVILDGGTRANRGVHGSRFSFSDLGPLAGGNLAANAWLVDLTDCGGSLFHNINTHSLVAGDPTDDDYAGLAPPTNGVYIAGSYNNRFQDCNLQGENRALGDGNYTGTAYWLDTDSFANLMVNAGCSFFHTGIKWTGTGQENTGINCDTESCMIGLECSIPRGIAINCGGFETSAFITGTHFTMIGGRFPGATGTTNTSTFKGAGNTIINHATVPIITGVGASAVILNHPTWLDRGAAITWITATGASEPTVATELTVCVPHSPLYGNDQGHALILSMTPGKGYVLGNGVDDAGFGQPRALKGDGFGVYQFVLKTDAKLNVTLANGTISQAITNSGNDLWFGNVISNIITTWGTGKQHVFYENGAADYVMHLSGVNLSMRNHRITDLSNPAAGTDAVNRDYVTSQIATLSAAITAATTISPFTGHTDDDTPIELLGRGGQRLPLVTNSSAYWFELRVMLFDIDNNGCDLYILNRVIMVDNAGNISSTGDAGMSRLGDGAFTIGDVNFEGFALDLVDGGGGQLKLIATGLVDRTVNWRVVSTTTEMLGE
jgi:hypothetical protein